MSFNPRKFYRAINCRLIAQVDAVNLFILFVLMVITVYPLLFVGFTTRDDAMIAINYGFESGLIDSTMIVAQSQGRFGFLWSYPLLRMPYAIDSTVWYMSMKIGALCILLVALYFAVKKIFTSHWLGLLSLLFFLVFIQNGWSHNGLTSYPLAFNLFASFFLFSIGLFVIAIEHDNLTFARYSGLLYFLALGSEIFVLFFPFYLVVYLFIDTNKGSVIRRLKSGRKYVLSIALPLFFYLIIYSVWRYIYPSTYEGNSLVSFDVSAAVKVILSYSLTAFPLYSSDVYLDALFQTPINPFEFLIANLIKPVIAGLFLFRLVAARFSVPNQKVLIGGIIVSGIGIFLPNLLVGFIQKYQTWVATGDYSYLYTYYSFISLAIFLALLFAYVNIKSHSWRKELRFLFALTGLILLVGIGFGVEVRNQYINFEQKQSYRKWQLMDEVINSSYFTQIPEGSTVIAPTLIKHHRGSVVVSTDYWTKYVKYKNGKNIQFVDSKCISWKPCYLIVFQQDMESDNQYIVLARIVNPDLLTSSDLEIYIMPFRPNSVLTGSFELGESSPKLEIDGKPIENIGDGLFTLKLAPFDTNKFVRPIRISSNSEIFPSLIKVSN